MEQKTFTQADLKKYIEGRAAHFNRNAYQIGLETPNGFVTAFLELSNLALWAGEYELALLYAEKAKKLAELLPEQGKPAFCGFTDLL